MVSLDLSRFGAAGRSESIASVAPDRADRTSLVSGGHSHKRPSMSRNYFTALMWNIHTMAVSPARHPCRESPVRREFRQSETHIGHDDVAAVGQQSDR